MGWKEDTTAKKMKKRKGKSFKIPHSFELTVAWRIERKYGKFGQKNREHGAKSEKVSIKFGRGWGEQAKVIVKQCQMIGKSLV